MKKLLMRAIVLGLCSFLLTGCGALVDVPVMLGEQVEEAREEAMEELNNTYLEVANEVYEEMSNEASAEALFEESAEASNEIVIEEPAIASTEEYVEVTEENVVFGLSGDDLFNDGVDAYLDGDYYSAIEKLELAITKGLVNEDLTELYSILGNAYLETYDFESAFDAYNKALEREPDNVTCIVNLAVAYRQYGDNDKAMELYEQALLIDPDYPELNSSLGSLYVLEGQPELAIVYFEKALDGDPTLAVTYGNAALAYAMTGDFEKADQYLEHSVELGYQNADVIEEMINDLRNGY